MMGKRRKCGTETKGKMGRAIGMWGIRYRQREKCNGDEKESTKGPLR